MYVVSRLLHSTNNQVENSKEKVSRQEEASDAILSGK